MTRVVATVGVPDAFGRTLTVFGAGRAFFTSGGQVFESDLLKSMSQQPRRISSLVDATAHPSLATGIQYRPLRADVNIDGWLRVGCAASADGCYVRAGGTSASVPTILPAGVNWMGVLPAPGGVSAAHVITCRYVGSSGTTQLYSTDLVAGATMPGAESFCATLHVLDAPSGGTAGYTIDPQGGLRRMTWDANGASVSAPIYSLVSSAVRSIGDAGAAYFLDRTALVRVTGSIGQRLATLPASWTSINLLAQTPSRVIAQASSGADSLFVSISKIDGTAVVLPGVYSMIGIVGADVVYMQRAPSGGPSGQIRRTLDTVGNDRLVLSMTPSLAHGPVAVRAREQRPSGLPPIVEVQQPPYTLNAPFREISGIVWCDQPAGDVDCRRGTLKSINLATGIVSTLGAFGSTDTSNLVHGLDFDSPLYEGVPFVVSESATGESFVARIDVAGSLTRFFVRP